MSQEELKIKSLRAQSQENETHPSNEADLIELDILQATNNLSKCKQETKKWRDKKVVRRDISVGDWVLKRKPNTETIGKLHAKWDGPFLVVKSYRSGSFYLADSEGHELQHS
jgi:hypothetical protein